MARLLILISLLFMACEPMPAEKAQKNKQHPMSHFKASIEKSNDASEKIGKHNRSMEQAMGMAEDR